MKRFSLLFLILLLVSMANATITTNMKEKPYEGGAIFTHAGTLDSIEVDTSRAFDLAEWDGFFTESDSNVLEIQAGYNIYSDSGSVKVSMKIQGSFDKENWMDAVTVVTDNTTETPQKLLLDFGKARFPYYRSITTGEATNNPYTQYEFWMYLPWPKIY